eukprot:2813687-Rhodomonas_salina.1
MAHATRARTETYTRATHRGRHAHDYTQCMASRGLQLDTQHCPDAGAALARLGPVLRLLLRSEP